MAISEQEFDPNLYVAQQFGEALTSALNGTVSGGKASIVVF